MNICFNNRNNKNMNIHNITEDLHEKQWKYFLNINEYVKMIRRRRRSSVYHKEM